MRVLLLFIRYSLTILITIGIGFLVFREVMLFWGTQQLKSSVNRIDLLSHRSTDYLEKCREKGGGSNGGGIRQFQVRFSTSRDYQVEVVCDFFSNDPVVVETHTLPMFVEKTPGQSGFIWDLNSESGVTLQVFGRRNTLILDQGKVVLKQGKADILGTQPSTVCTGYGYQCCDEVTQAGQGDVFANATDCSESCYAVCKPRPSILKFTSDPTPEIQTRAITLGRNDLITFYFVTDPAGALSPVVTLNFGDGKSQELTQKDGNFAYQYHCTEPTCQYQATVTVNDPSQDISSIITPLSTITVIVH